jgi:hypothetical protein
MKLVFSILSTLCLALSSTNQYVNNFIPLQTTFTPTNQFVTPLQTTFTPTNQFVTPLQTTFTQSRPLQTTFTPTNQYVNNVTPLQTTFTQSRPLQTTFTQSTPFPTRPFVNNFTIHLPFTFVTATASGDPHIDTFDGLHHDLMVSGWFVMVKNPIVTVHAYSQLGCMPPTIRNTCIRSIIVEISPSDGSNLMLSWGSWPPIGKKGDQHVVIHDSFGKNVDIPFSFYKSKVFLGGKYRIFKSKGNIVISPIGETISDPEMAISITIGTYLLAVTLPKSAPHLYSTNGLLGFFNGNTKEYGKVFRNSDGSSSTKKNQMKWALSHATTVLPLQRYGIPPLSKPVVHPGRIPMFTIKKIDFCKKMLLKLYRKQSIKIQQRFKTQMKSCLQDADSPSVAGSIGKVIRISRLQQQASVKALVKVVKRKIEKEKKEKMKDDDDE